MIDLSQKARAGRARAIDLSRQTRHNVFFDAPDVAHRSRAKAAA